jgi:hypothetical protein
MAKYVQPYTADAVVVNKVNLRNAKPILNELPRAAFVAPVYLTATKTATGATLPDGQFSFGVFDQNGNLKATAVNDADGNIVFPRVDITSLGIFNYTIRELTPSGNGWTTDRTIFPVIRTAFDDLGRPTADVYFPDGTPTFNNDFHSEPSTAEIIAFKVIVGGTGMEVFNFELLDENGDVIETAQNDALGVIHYPPLTYTAPGVYTYTTRETGVYPGWIVDPGEFHVIVTVEDIGGELMVTSIEYPEGPPHFSNRFDETEPGCTVNGQQLIDVRVPVTVKPFATIGTIVTRCCGEATITPGIDIDEGIIDGECNFTISQRLCVEVPVDFGADVEPGDTYVTCTGEDCSDCVSG